jgi:hypothetical protein
MKSVALRVRAFVALGAFAGTLLVPLVSARHLFQIDDPACARIDWSTGSPAGTIDEAGPASPADHCALCHWMRAVGGSQTDVTVEIAAWLQPAGVLPALVPCGLASPVCAERPARAPPSDLS